MSKVHKFLVACALACTLTLASAPGANSYSGTSGKGCTAYQYAYGGTGTCVKYIQTMLNGIRTQYSYGGYALSVDGDFGSNTRTNVKRFQTFNSLEPDGWVGPRTWSELCFYAGQVAFAYSFASAAQRSAWQAAYNAGCYVEKPASGSPGYVTISRY